MWKCAGLGHKAKYCTEEAMCSLCGGEGHTFFQCPVSYAGMVRTGAASNPRPDQDGERESEPAASDPAPSINHPQHPRQSVRLVCAVTAAGPGDRAQERASQDSRRRKKWNQ